MLCLFFYLFCLTSPPPQNIKNVANAETCHEAIAFFAIDVVCKVKPVRILQHFSAFSQGPLTKPFSCRVSIRNLAAKGFLCAMALVDSDLGLTKIEWLILSRWSHLLCYPTILEEQMSALTELMHCQPFCMLALWAELQKYWS